MKKLLLLKHWQIFTLMIGLAVALQIPTLGMAIYSSEKLIFLFPVIMILATFLFLGWFYTLVTGLHTKLPSSVVMNLNRFKIALFIPAIYMSVISIFMAIPHANISYNWMIKPSTAIIIFFLHIFSMFCIFYCLYYTAKALKSVEWQKPVNFGDFAGEFFLIWFFPLGVWIIQPRINNLFTKELTDMA